MFKISVSKTQLCYPPQEVHQATTFYTSFIVPNQHKATATHKTLHSIFEALHIKWEKEFCKISFYVGLDL